MNNALSTDVASLADTIRDKVRTTIAAAIPDGQLDGLIKKEWETFFVVPQPRNSYDAKPEHSPFQLMIKAEMEKLIREKVAEGVRKEMDRFNVSTWDAQGKKTLEMIIKEYAPAAIEGVAGAIVHSTLQRLNQNRPY